MKRAAGLTLIELLIALALFSVIGTLCWRATTQMVDGRAAIGDELARWNDIARALQRVESELSALLPTAGVLVRASDDEAAQPLVFVTLGEGDGPARSAFRVESGRLDWLYQPAGDALQEAETTPLLDGVELLDWRFLAAGEWSDEWPPEGAEADEQPDAVAVELELSDAGTILRVFALR